MSSAAIDDRRKRLIDLLHRDGAEDGDVHARQRSDLALLRGRAKVTLSAEGAALIGAGVLERLADHPEVRAVGGLTIGADPIVGAALAMAGTAGRGISAASWSGRGRGARHRQPRRGAARAGLDRRHRR